MSKSIRFCVLGLLLCIGIGSGLCVFLGQNHHQRPTFPVDIKFTGQPLDVDEKKLFDKISSDNTKFIASLSTDDKALLSSISNKVKKAVKKNPKIKIKYKDLLTKDENKVVHLVRKDRKERRDKSPIDKKLYSHMIKKLNQEQVMALLLYIR